MRQGWSRGPTGSRGRLALGILQYGAQSKVVKSEVCFLKRRHQGAPVSGHSRQSESGVNGTLSVNGTLTMIQRNLPVIQRNLPMAQRNLPVIQRNLPLIQRNLPVISTNVHDIKLT